MASGAQLFQGDAGVDAQIFLEMTPGLAAQTFQRLDFVREKPLLHRQFDVEDFQALLRDHPVTESGRVPPQDSRNWSPTWSGWTLMPPTEKMGSVPPVISRRARVRPQAQGSCRSEVRSPLRKRGTRGKAAVSGW